MFRSAEFCGCLNGVFVAATLGSRFLITRIHGEIGICVAWITLRRILVVILQPCWLKEVAKIIRIIVVDKQVPIGLKNQILIAQAHPFPGQGKKCIKSQLGDPG